MDYWIDKSIVFTQHLKQKLDFYLYVVDFLKALIWKILRTLRKSEEDLFLLLKVVK